MLKRDSIIAKQTVSATTNQPSTTTTLQPKKPELFNSGFIDFQNSGQMNAAARVFKLYIGEPGKFMLPLSVYSGVSGNNVNTGNAFSQKGSEQMILGLINPMSGLFNLSTDNSFRFNKKPKSITGFSFVYQLGEKVIAGQQAYTLKPFSFFSTYANSGLLFQTGAWEKDKEKNMGVFWLLFRYHVVSISNSFQSISGYPPSKNIFKGISIGMGIEINNVLNIKSYYYHYVNPGTADFEIPIYQLTFNYSMR
ncbi:MAG: hypothetical protein M3Y85_03020 [Bacteroidota bacterium]|nr:hypothetical protein [Bacteroidota bacterium]